jgi:hypothetical protein
MYAIAEAIKQEVAEAIVRQAAPGYDTRYHGEYYAVDTDGDGELDEVMHAEAQRQWNPWSDSATAIPVEQCVDSDGADFDPSPADGVSDEDAFAAAVDLALWAILDRVELRAEEA